MKLDLKEPYKSDFKSAYCCKNKEPRRVVSLIREDGSRTSTSYARYLMSCHLGRYLKDEEHVDHINENQLDDKIANLQILSPKENQNKSHKKGRKYLKMVCPVCGDVFEKEKRQTNLGKGEKYSNYQTCSRFCGGKSSHIKSRKLEKNFEIIKRFQK